MWDGFSLKWYRELFRDRDILDAISNSLVLATVSSLLAAVIGTLAAVGMPKVKWRTKGIVEYLSTLPIMIPEIILGMVFLVYFTLIRLPFGMTTLVIAHTSFCIPYVYMLVKARLVGIDKSSLKRRRILGQASGTSSDITLPLILPAILSGVLLAFAMSFDDVIISIFVTGVNTNTLPMKIYTQLKTGVTPKINALCTLMFVATVLIVFLSSWLGRKGTRIAQRRKSNEESPDTHSSVSLVR